MEVSRYRDLPEVRTGRRLGWAVGGVGLLTIISALGHGVPERLSSASSVLVPELLPFARGATALLGVAIVFEGRGIARRRRLSYLVVLVFLLLSVITHLLKGLDIEAAALSGAAAALLFANREIFVKPLPRRRLASLAVLIVGMAVGLFAYGMVGFALRRRDAIGFSWTAAVRSTLDAMIGNPTELNFQSRFGDWFPDTIALLAPAAVVIVAFSLLRPAPAKHFPTAPGGADPHDRAAVAKLADNDMGDSLDPFALRADKSYVFSPDGHATVVYRYVNGIALASGDPVGDPDSFDAAIRAFLDLCPERGFSMALEEAFTGRYPDCVVVVAHAHDGEPIAFQRYAPARAGRTLSLDAMRRDGVGPNGLNERLIVETIEWARAHRYDEVSLNFAAFRGFIEATDTQSRFTALQGWAVRSISPRFQIESLAKFNAKFQPRWVPRAVAYASRADLAAVALANVSAERFLPFDRRTSN